MFLRKIAFVLVILLFAVLAVTMVADLVKTKKRIDNNSKRNTTNSNRKTNARKSRTY